MQNIYDILSVAGNASNKEINAALRQLVRRYNEETAEGSRDSAEALQFINLARLTFADSVRRARYDADLTAFQAEQAQIIAEQQQSAGKKSPARARPSPAFALTAGRTAATIIPWPVSAAAGLASAEYTTLDPIMIEIPIDENLSYLKLANGPGPPAKAHDLNAVLLARGSTAKRSTAPHPLPRLAARLLDYGLWGVALALLLHTLGHAGWLSAAVTQWLANPFIASVLITLSWAIVEAGLLLFFSATPGKYLLNIRVALNVSNPYAAMNPGANVAAALVRASHVCWRGMAIGIVPLCLLTSWRSRRKLISFKETTWDFDSDCLVTHGKVAPLQGLVAFTLLFLGAWFYVVQWSMPFQQTVSMGWQSSRAGFFAAQEMWQVLGGNLPAYARQEVPAAPARENRTMTLEKDAQTLVDRHDWQLLSRLCLGWTREDPRYASAWYCYGRARFQLGDHSGAITALKRGRLLAPQNDDIRRLLKDASRVAMQQKQMRERPETGQYRQESEE